MTARWLLPLIVVVLAAALIQPASATTNLTVSTGQEFYFPGDRVKAFGALADGRAPVAAANITILILTPSNGFAFQGSALTGTDGEYAAEFTLAGTAEIGSYAVAAAYQMFVARTVFVVQQAPTTTTSSTTTQTGQSSETASSTSVRTESETTKTEEPSGHDEINPWVALPLAAFAVPFGILLVRNRLYRHRRRIAKRQKRAKNTAQHGQKACADPPPDLTGPAAKDPINEIEKMLRLRKGRDMEA